DDLWIAAPLYEGVTRRIAALRVAAGGGEFVSCSRDPDAPGRRVSVAVSEALLAPGEEGLLVLTASSELDALLGVEDPGVPETPDASRIAVTNYVHVTLLVTTDGVTFAEVPEARLDTNPIRIRFENVPDGMVEGV